MAQTVEKNYTDSGVSGVSTLTKDLAILNYGVDFRVKKDEPDEVILTNLTSPVDRPETIRISTSTIADIYKGAGIDPAYNCASKKGISLLCQLNDVYRIVDSTDPTFDKRIPISGHIVLKVPCTELLTAADISTFIGRLVAGLFESGVNTPTRLTSLLRGVLTPSDL